MAKVSLRIYNREIESLVDQGNTDEAIAHCHHILKTFPKHLETYRLLGKAYLEARHYNEAVDIFSRVLMSVPNDFVSHVGMSIINDEQNKLDNAIWHMERAFEAQPSNAAIQGELQRLYARRDGLEPPKIRMTRGALAHMYVQGELYPQAIAEIRAVLAEDAQRADMQVLLAKAYFKGGQKADASDMCTQLLKRYPYCFDANRIMVELLPATAGAAESTQVYRMRVGELDPYATFAKGSVFQSGEVADAAINLERLEYTGNEVPIGQEWGSSLGIGLGAGAAAGALASGSSSEQPDWLKSGIFSDSQSSSEPTSGATSPDAEIPDFLRAAGWGESSGGEEQPTSFFDASEPAVGGDSLAPADIPDWLKGQMPSEPAPAKPSTPVNSIDTPDWLSGLGDMGSASQLDSLQEESTPMNPADVPDWLSGVGDAQSMEQPAQQGNVPDWLSGLGSSDHSDASELQPVSMQDAAASEDWLSVNDAPASETSDTPDWLSGLSNSETPQNDLAQPADIPDWLSAPKEQPASTADNLGATAQEQDDAVAWLESLAAKHGAKPEELVTDPNKRSETPPDWVQQAQTVGEAQAATPANADSLGSTAQEQDDAVAWLESLAAKHGAKPEELVTDPNKRSETPPDWVQQAQTVGEAQAATPTNADSLGSTAQEQDDAVAWLESLAAKHGAKPEELVTDPNKRSETPPDWVQQAQAVGEAETAAASESPKEWSEQAQNIGEQFFADFESAASTPAVDETGMWLKDLDNKQDEPSLQRGDIPDWLSDTQNEKPNQNQKPDFPNWASGDSDNQEFVAENLSQEDLSNWLSNLDDGFQTDETAPSTRRDVPEWLGQTNDTEEQDDDWKDAIGLGASQEKASLPDWLDDSTNASASTPTEEAAPVKLTADLPDWLQGVDEQTASEDGDDTPPWLTREQWEVDNEKIIPTPTAPTDWHPIVEPATESPATPKPEQPKQTKPQPQAKPAPAQKPPSKKTGAKSSEPQGSPAALTQAKGELDRGDIPAALEHYGKLIKKGKHLEETIRDLSESLYRYPVEVGIWQTLGDAYMRANRLKEALESYNKAEELIR